jgi:hypothetical protein
MIEKPISVRVAEALGEKPLDAEWGYSGPPEEGTWSHERSRLFKTIDEAKAAYTAMGIVKSQPDEWYLCYWKDGWGPICVPEYDTEWFETGPLIEKYGMQIHPSLLTGGWYAWENLASRPDSWSSKPPDPPLLSGHGDTPLIAVCNLILNLKEAGKL